MSNVQKPHEGDKDIMDYPRDIESMNERSRRMSPFIHIIMNSVKRGRYTNLLEIGVGSGSISIPLSLIDKYACIKAIEIDEKKMDRFHNYFNIYSMEIQTYLGNGVKIREMGIDAPDIIYHDFLMDEFNNSDKFSIIQSQLSLCKSLVFCMDAHVGSPLGFSALDYSSWMPLSRVQECGCFRFDDYYNVAYFSLIGDLS